MVTTTKKTNHLKIERMCFAFSLFFCVLSAFSQTIENVSNLSAAERDFQFKLFENRYFQIPSLLNQANLGKFSYGEGKYLYSEGALRHPQEYKKQNGLYVETASLAPLESTNWILYGGLEYLNSRKEEVENNLTYGIKEYGSPYYFFQETTGLWNHQNYNFQVSGANSINSKLTLGGYLNYDTNFYFRKTDTRNELTALKILAKVALSYKLNQKHMLSLALSNEFFKTDSELGNKFPENNTEATANYYLNTGLGSYIKNIDNGFESKRSIPNLQLQWLFKHNNSDLSIESSTGYGLERWIDKNIVRVEENDELTKYNFFRERLNIYYNSYKTNKLVALSLNAEYLKGKAKVWDENGAYYNQNFTSTSYRVKTEGNILFYNQFLNKLSIGVNYYNKKQLDLNYAYQFDYQYLESEISLGINKKLSQKAAFFTDLGVLYHLVLDMEHDPFAANNIFVDWIGNKVANYTDIDTFNVNTKIGVDFALKHNNKLEFSITGDYLKATSLSSSEVSYFSKNEDYLSLVAGLKLYF